MQARMSNPATLVKGAMQPIMDLWTAARQSGLPPRTLELVHVRASQINGCAFCVDSGSRSAKKSGETDDRLFALPVWRDARGFTEAERAALALTEAVTRLSDRADAVPDGVWDEARRHYDEPALAALLIAIATVNVWNRLNVATRQVPGEWR